MEAICSSETSVETQRTTRRHIPEDDTLHNHRCVNLILQEIGLFHWSSNLKSPSRLCETILQATPRFNVDIGLGLPAAVCWQCGIVSFFLLPIVPTFRFPLLLGHCATVDGVCTVGGGGHCDVITDEP
jgi:hypothetical protein